MGLEIVEIVMRLEEEFGIEISDEDAALLETVGDVVACVTMKLEATGEARSPVRDRVLEVMAEEAGGSAADLHDSTHLVKDLNLG